MKKRNVFSKVMSVVMASAMALGLFTASPSAGLEVKADDGIIAISENMEFTRYEFSAIPCVYKVTLPADGKLTLSAMVYTGDDTKLDMNGYKSSSFDDDGRIMNGQVRGQGISSPGTGSCEAILAAGTYYIRITLLNNHEYAAGSYFKLKTEFENFGVKEDTPDSYDSPKAYALGTTVTDDLNESDDVDWYRVNIEKPGKYTFKFTSYHASVYGDLCDESCSKHNEWSTWPTNGPDTKVNEVTLDAGVHYIKFSGNDQTKYTFSVDQKKIKGTTLASVKSKVSKSVDVTFKTAKDVTGYEIRYSTDQKFEKGVKTKSFTDKKAKSAGKNKKVYTIKKLKKGKKYFFQIRTYKKENGVKYYSDWSKSKKVKVK